MLARNRTVLSRVTSFQRDHTICEQREFQVTRVTVACSQPPLRHPRVQNDATLDQHRLFPCQCRQIDRIATDQSAGVPISFLVGLGSVIRSLPGLRMASPGRCLGVAGRGA
jgi:hypothetical protein